MPRISIKGQVLIDLVVEFAKSPLEERMEKQDMVGKSVRLVSLQEPCFGGYMLIVQRIIEDLE